MAVTASGVSSRGDRGPELLQDTIPCILPLALGVLGESTGPCVSVPRGSSGDHLAKDRRWPHAEDAWLCLLSLGVLFLGTEKASKVAFMDFFICSFETGSGYIGYRLALNS